MKKFTSWCVEVASIGFVIGLIIASVYVISRIGCFIVDSIFQIYDLEERKISLSQKEYELKENIEIFRNVQSQNNTLDDDKTIVKIPNCESIVDITISKKYVDDKILPANQYKVLYRKPEGIGRLKFNVFEYFYLTSYTPLHNLDFNCDLKAE